VSDKQLKIAVIGGGVAGLTACHILQREHNVTLFEKNDYVGGHTNTILVDNESEKGLAVDTGFIVCNDKTYPLFHELIKQLGVKVRWSDMSFSYFCKKTNFYYAGTNLAGMFAQRKNIFSPRLWSMLFEIGRFSKKGLVDLDNGHLTGLTLGDYIKASNFSNTLVNDYLFPMGSAIWSAPCEKMSEFPAEAFIAFFRNHGLLSVKDRPRWQTIEGGSHSYVKSFLETWKGDVFTSSKVEKIVRAKDSVSIQLKDHSSKDFDKVIIATHADQALSLLDEPSNQEKSLLGAWEYQKNVAVLHTDKSVMPPKRRGWASWNHIREVDASDTAPASVSYYMNKLQGLDGPTDYFVTLNRDRPYNRSDVIREIHYTHPQYTLDSLKTQKHFESIQGEQNTFYCGSYHGYGFHEDAVRSAVKVAKCFGLKL
jgi:predicted NAD/FAD-binding protein